MRDCPVCYRDDEVELNPNVDPRFNPAGSSGISSDGKRSGSFTLKLVCKRCGVEFDVTKTHKSIDIPKVDNLEQDNIL